MVIHDASVIIVNMGNQRKKHQNKLILEQTVPKKELRKDGVYQLYSRKTLNEGFQKKELAVFSHIGSTGMPVFHPLGEPSFQDVFCLEDYEAYWVAIFEREGNPEDLGY